MDSVVLGNQLVDDHESVLAINKWREVSPAIQSTAVLAFIYLTLIIKHIITQFKTRQIVLQLGNAVLTPRHQIVPDIVHRYLQLINSTQRNGILVDAFSVLVDVTPDEIIQVFVILEDSLVD